MNQSWQIVNKNSTLILLRLRYESKGIGCYMFKINEDTVIGKLILIKNLSFYY